MGAAVRVNQLARAANAGDRMSVAQLAAAVEYLARAGGRLDRLAPSRVPHRCGAR